MYVDLAPDSIYWTNTTLTIVPPGISWDFIWIALKTRHEKASLSAAKMHFNANTSTHLWRRLETHLVQTHHQCIYRKFCAEIQAERARLSNRWQKVTCLPERIVKMLEDGDILTANDVHVSLVYNTLNLGIGCMLIWGVKGDKHTHRYTNSHTCTFKYDFLSFLLASPWTRACQLNG